MSSGVVEPASLEHSSAVVAFSIMGNMKNNPDDIENRP
jgi:hypothetical protein